MTRDEKELKWLNLAVVCAIGLLGGVLEELGKTGTQRLLGIVTLLVAVILSLFWGNHYYWRSPSPNKRD